MQGALQRAFPWNRCLQPRMNTGKWTQGHSRKYYLHEQKIRTDCSWFPETRKSHLGSVASWQQMLTIFNLFSTKPGELYGDCKGVRSRYRWKVKAGSSWSESTGGKVSNGWHPGKEGNIEMEELSKKRYWGEDNRRRWQEEAAPTFMVGEEESEIYLQGIRKVPQSLRDKTAPSELGGEDWSPGVGVSSHWWPGAPWDLRSSPCMSVRSQLHTAHQEEQEEQMPTRRVWIATMQGRGAPSWSSKMAVETEREGAHLGLV